MLQRLSVFLVLAGLVALSMAVYTVDEREHAIKFQFNKIVASDILPGIHLKLPIAETVKFYPDRILTINNPKELFLTFEKKNLFVDFFVKWRISDVAEYYRVTNGEELQAAQRLLEIVKDGIRAEFAKRTVPEVVTAERREIMDEMLTNARRDAARFGIELVDIRVKRIEFSDEVSESVYNRMRQERARTASELRAEGAENAEQIRADADRQRTILLAEAYRDAEKLRGEGDAKAADTYARAYGKNEEFFNFYRSMQAYRRAVGREQDLLVLDADSDFLQYLNDAQPVP